jgi:catechol 2,3-dioxygenase-like lactoylglutathione lyase family enzyme
MICCGIATGNALAEEIMDLAVGTSSLIRAALFVSDLARSTAFYTELGLSEVYYEGELDPASTAAVLALPPGGGARCRILKRPGTPNYGMIGLFQVINATQERIAMGTATPRIGEVALVFYVKPLAQALAHLKEKGAAWVGDPSLFTMPHRSQAEVCLRDPDGVLLNLIERSADEQFSDQPVKRPG